MNYVIGPLHIHTIFTHQIDNEIQHNTLFHNCILDGYIGIPNWSKHIYTCIRENTNTHNNIVWIVSDYTFNNYNYPKILDIQKRDELFLDEVGCCGNISHDFLRDYHIEVLGNHSLHVIDYIIHTFPRIKLIFWCLYKRTKANKHSFYPKHLWYDTIKKKYKKNIIDIDLFTNPKDFNSAILDEGGHPNKQGYIILDKMIQSAFSTQR